MITRVINWLWSVYIDQTLFFCACNGPRKRKETQAERELREVPWLCLSRKLVIPLLSGGGEGGGEEFLNFAAYLACVAWRFKQSERAAANTSGEAARRNLGERLSQTPRGFAASFRNFLSALRLLKPPSYAGYSILGRLRRLSFSKSCWARST